MPASATAGFYCGICLAGKRSVSFSVMRFAWQDPVSSLISQFKYQSKLHYGKVLSTLLLEQIRLAYAQRQLPDLLVPVPLHANKLRLRGYNQALLIARHLSRELDIPCSHTLVQRTRNTPSQKGLRAAQRRLNLRGAFKVNLKECLTSNQVLGIALIDDVVTTMTTAETLARAIRKQFGDKVEIHLWALARA